MADPLTALCPVQRNFIPGVDLSCHTTFPNLLPPLLVYNRTCQFLVYTVHTQCSGIPSQMGSTEHNIMAMTSIDLPGGGKGKPAIISCVISVLVGEIIKHEG